MLDFARSDVGRWLAEIKGLRFAAVIAAVLLIVVLLAAYSTRRKRRPLRLRLRLCERRHKTNLPPDRDARPTAAAAVADRAKASPTPTSAAGDIIAQIARRSVVAPAQQSDRCGRHVERKAGAGRPGCSADERPEESRLCDQPPARRCDRSG
jgi:hypothetical protein